MSYIDPEIHWKGPDGRAPCWPITGWDGPLHPQRKYVTCPYCRAAAYAEPEVKIEIKYNRPAICLCCRSMNVFTHCRGCQWTVCHDCTAVSVYRTTPEGRKSWYFGGPTGGQNRWSK